MVVKEKLHRLVEELPEGQWKQARRLLENLRSPVAEVDSDPLSPSELKAIRKSLEQIQRGETVSREKYRSRRNR